MLHMMLLSLALSWDSFLVGLLDGCLDLRGTSRRYLSIMFGLCDGAAVGIGLFAAAEPFVRVGQFAEGWWLPAWLLLLFVTLQRLTQRPSRELGWLIYLVPVLLSLDNLVAGPAFTQLGISPVLCVTSAAAVSAALFVAGAACGRVLRTQALFGHAAR
jgi:putative Mn2+ efflux pump MntP